MEQPGNVHDTEMLVLWSTQIYGQDVIREPSIEMIYILLGAGR